MGQWRAEGGIEEAKPPQLPPLARPHINDLASKHDSSEFGQQIQLVRDGNS